MRRANKAEKIGIILDELYPEQPIPLDHTDPYTLLVAVMLSAQTTDKKVNEVTPNLFSKADMKPFCLQPYHETSYSFQIPTPVLVGQLASKICNCKD